MVNCAPGFSKTPAVINGFTDLILEIWGEAGRHARSAIGAAELPFNAPVEVEASSRFSEPVVGRPPAWAPASGGAEHLPTQR